MQRGSFLAVAQERRREWSNPGYCRQKSGSAREGKRIVERCGAFGARSFQRSLPGPKSSLRDGDLSSEKCSWGLTRSLTSILLTLIGPWRSIFNISEVSHVLCSFRERIHDSLIAHWKTLIDKNRELLPNERENRIESLFIERSRMEFSQALGRYICYVTLQHNYGIQCTIRIKEN